MLYLACNFVYLSVLTLPQIQTAPEDRVATAVVSVMFGAGGHQNSWPPPSWSPPSAAATA
jgi:hypothetical protein